MTHLLCILALALAVAFGEWRLRKARRDLLAAMRVGIDREAELRRGMAERVTRLQMDVYSLSERKANSRRKRKLPDVSGAIAPMTDEEAERVKALFMTSQNPSKDTKP